MTARKKHAPEPPCDHWNDLAGTVGAGDIKGKGKFCGVATCSACVTASAGYVQMVTGLPANPFEPYREAS